MRENSEEIYDAIVIGGGPAGITAAIYLARARFSVAVLEKENIGGQITITDEVVNYPGVLRTTGKALTETMRQQAENFGADFIATDVRAIDFENNVKTVKTSRGDFRALGIVVATGARPRTVGFKGENEFRGHGVAYCATCDGEFFAGKELLVVGGGFAACEEALFLTRYATKITMLVRRDAFSCAQSVVEKIMENPKISVRFNTEIVELRGNAMPEIAVLKNNKSGETEEFRASDGGAFGVFVFAGYSPAAELLDGKIETDKDGYAVANEDGKTNIAGVFVAGDLRKKRLRQVVTAVADGAIAATALEKEIPELRASAGVKTKTARAENASKKSQVAQDSTISEEAESVPVADAFFDASARAQLRTVFSKFEKNIVLAVETDNGSVGDELRRFAEELAGISDKILVRIGAPVGSEPAEMRPVITICDANGKSLRARFFGVPGGHEVNSFIAALYNAATSAGQAIDGDVLARIRTISSPSKIQVLVSLSCTLCPATVAAAQRIALENENVSADAIDIARFPEVREQFGVMSVPALVVDGKLVGFGKKTIPQILEYIEKK